MARIRAVIMAGGRGSRFGGPHKPLARVCGRPMILWIASAAARLGEVVIATSPRTSGLLERICRLYRCVETSGRGYAEDLAEVLEKIPPPVLILPADMPFITAKTLEEFAHRALAEQAQLVTLRRCLGSLCEPAGISLFKGPPPSPAAEWQWANIDIPFTHELLDIDTPNSVAQFHRGATTTALNGCEEASPGQGQRIRTGYDDERA